MTIVEPPIRIVDVVQDPVMQVEPRRYNIIRRPVIPDDFVVYLLEGADVGDPVNFDEAKKSGQSTQWSEAVKEKLKSIERNSVWELTMLPENFKLVECKWIFKTKRDSEER